ncbi:MAG: hypothetical protein HXX13_15400 [Bacteroidetes bacterium]|nr:hypothetical protein [Bacteroidota bacterium]
MNTNRNFPVRKTARLSGFDYRTPGFYFVTFCTKNNIRYFGEVFDKKMILSETGTLANKYWLQIPLHNREVRLDEFVIMPNHVHGIIRILDAEGDNEGFPWPFRKAIGINYESGISDPIHPSSIVRMLHCDIRTMEEIASGSIEEIASGSKKEIASKDWNERYVDVGNEGLFNPVIERIEEQNLIESELEKSIIKCLYPAREPGKNHAMAKISPKKGSLSAIIRTYKSAVSYDLHKMGINFAWHCRFYDRVVRNPEELERIRWYIRNNPKRWGNDILK